jgi:hypothetical protein
MICSTFCRKIGSGASFFMLLQREQQVAVFSRVKHLFESMRSTRLRPALSKAPQYLHGLSENSENSALESLNSTRLAEAAFLDLRNNSSCIVFIDGLLDEDEDIIDNPRVNSIVF